MPASFVLSLWEPLQYDVYLWVIYIVFNITLSIELRNIAHKQVKQSVFIHTASGEPCHFILTLHNLRSNGNNKFKLCADSFIRDLAHYRYLKNGSVWLIIREKNTPYVNLYYIPTHLLGMDRLLKIFSGLVGFCWIPLL